MKEQWKQFQCNEAKFLSAEYEGKFEDWATLHNTDKERPINKICGSTIETIK